MHPHGQHTPTRTVLKWSLAATTAFIAVEILAGLQARSLALLSDAGHNFTDALALLLAWFGHYLESRPADDLRTYGYRRAGVLAAFINALALIVLAGFIFYESYHRLRDPHPVDEVTMMVIAGLGLILNLAIMWWMRHDQRHDLNIRSAYLHMLGDALGSIGILIGAVLIRYTGWYPIDPLLSVLIGGLIIWTASDVIRESLNILLEGAPRGVEVQSLLSAMREVEGVCDVHDLHVWSLGSSAHALSCHVLIEDMPHSQSQVILDRLNRLLQERFCITHTTIQLEHTNCAHYANGCPITPPPASPGASS